MLGYLLSDRRLLGLVLSCCMISSSCLLRERFRMLLCCFVLLLSFLCRLTFLLALTFSCMLQCRFVFQLGLCSIRLLIRLEFGRMFLVSALPEHSIVPGVLALFFLLESEDMRLLELLLKQHSPALSSMLCWLFCAFLVLCLLIGMLLLLVLQNILLLLLLLLRLQVNALAVAYSLYILSALFALCLLNYGCL